MKKLKADMELIRIADFFLIETELLYSFNHFCDNLLLNNAENWLHSDRWSVIYDWLEEQTIESEKPEAIVTALTEYFEAMHIGIKEIE